MKKKKDQLIVKIEKGRKRLTLKTPLRHVGRVVLVFNDQFTNSPNTTQLASGAGRSSAAGNNAAINSPHTNQQQSVGAGGKAINFELKDSKKTKHAEHDHQNKDKSHHKKMDHSKKEIVVVFNKQTVKLPKKSQNASATQVASGAGTFSTGGTNSAIESRFY